MREEDPRPLAQSLGSAAVGIGLGIGILALGFAVSRFALPDNVVAAETFAPSAPVVTAAALATPSPTPTGKPSPTPTVKPTTTPDPMNVAAAQGQGLKLAAITIPSGYTFTAPIAGKVSIQLYEWADGQIKTGLTDQPSYPYIFIQSADRQIKIRPGIVDKDITLLVKDGDTVLAGAPLFRTLTTGASSWATFYDSSINAEVVVSAVDLTTNQAIDPVPLFKR